VQYGGYALLDNISSKITVDMLSRRKTELNTSARTQITTTGSLV